VKHSRRDSCILGAVLSHHRRFAVALLLCGLAVAAGAFAQTVPPATQAATFGKIFGFDRAIDRAKLHVLLVGDPGTKDAAAALQAAFAGIGITAEPVPSASARGRFEPGGVAYLLPGAATPALLDAAAAAHTLTVAGDASLAEAGKVSVGLGMRGDKPEIVVNLERVQQEGHDFAAQLLSFARVIRPSGSSGGAAVLQAPVLVGLAKPDYPLMARKLQVQGDVVMRLAIDESGKVTSVEVIKPIGRGGLDEAAVAAARSARFKPATRDGVAVAGTYVLTMPFRL